MGDKDAVNVCGRAAIHQIFHNGGFISTCFDMKQKREKRHTRTGECDPAVYGNDTPKINQLFGFF